MDMIDFLLALDNVVRRRCTDRNQILYVMVIDDLLQYISGEPVNFGIQDFALEEEDIFGEELDFCWCGVDKSPYGFTVKAFQSYVLDCQDMAHILWEALYRLDENGNEAMGEEEGVEYARDAYKRFKAEVQDMGYQNLNEMLAQDGIANCYYEMHEELFSCAHNMEETLALLELVIHSGEDEGNECGSLNKHILSLESPALDSWTYFVASNGDRVSEKDMQRYQEILSGLENEEITYETANEGIELNSFWGKTKDPDKWYRTVIHDEYCFYNSYGINTGCLFAYSLISLRYLAVMLSMCDFLREMDKKHHYLALPERQGGKEDGSI